MKTTEKIYWVNGIQIRGKDFYTINFNISNVGIMIAFSYSLKYLSFNIFKLL